MSHKIELPYNIGEKFYSNRIGIACEHEILKINIEIIIGSPMEALYVTRGDTLIFASNAMFKTREDAVVDLVKNIDGLDINKVVDELLGSNKIGNLPILDVLDNNASITVDSNEQKEVIKEDIQDCSEEEIEEFFVGEKIIMKENYMTNLECNNPLLGMGVDFDVSGISEDKYSIYLFGFDNLAFDSRNFTKKTQ